MKKIIYIVVALVLITIVVIRLKSNKETTVKEFINTIKNRPSMYRPSH